MIGLLANPFMNSTVATPPEAVAQAGASPHLQDASAVLFESSSNERRSEKAPAPDALNPHESAGALDELQELLAYAHKRHRVFAPDEEAIMAVAYDESAPRAPDCDAVWRDEAPLFLRQVG